MLFKQTAKIFISLFVCLLASFFILVPLAHADIGITIYPLNYKLTLNPGQEWEGITTVVNPNNFPLTVKPEKENIIGGAEGNVSLTTEEISQYGLMNWISFDENEFTLEPNASKEFHYKIKIPDNAPPGGHYAAILFRGIPPEEMTGIGVSGRTGTIILVEVTGNVIKKAEITSLNTPSFIAHGPLAVNFKIKNDGNSYIFPEGKVIISGWLQKQELTWEPRVVFPGFERTIDVKWDKRYLFGPLTITVNAFIPNGPMLEPVKITTWAFPYQEIIIILLIIVLIIWGVKTFKRKFKIVKVGKSEELNSSKETKI